MNKWVWLSVVGYLLSACMRQSAQSQKGKSIQKDTIQVVNTIAQETRTIQVDSTFTSIDSTDIDVKCKRYGPVVARAEGRIGYVNYHEEASMYSITYTFPGLTDEQWTGYVCNLPDDYKKKGLKVGFVGSYYVAYQSIKARHAADTPLFLVLERIKVLQ